MLVTYAPAYSETPESSTAEQYGAEARKRLEVIDSQGGIDRNEAKEICELYGFSTTTDGAPSMTVVMSGSELS